MSHMPTKRPRISPSAEALNRPSLQPLQSTPGDSNDDNDDGKNDSLDTDTKLALLSSLFPSLELSHADLLEILISASGSLKKAQSLLGSHQAQTKPSAPLSPPFKRRKPVSSTQSSLSSFLPGGIASPGSLAAGKVLSGSLPLPRPQKGKPILIFKPEHVSALTPCTLITSFLPAELANELLVELVKEAETFPKKGSKETRFRLFGGEKEVWSEHTSGFFVRGKKGEGEGDDEFDENWYTYNGMRSQRVRGFTQNMERVTEMVERRVREIIEARWERESRRRKYESPYPWSTNAAFVNCYDGGGESVGWHADQVTYLGPHSTIASVSLGVGREFGLKKEGGDGGVIKIWLPHNSLLVMEAGTQEEWKHWLAPSPSLFFIFRTCVWLTWFNKYSIYPAAAITSHPLSESKRINITYRCYRKSLSPKYIPQCRCPLPGILRTVMDSKSENYQKYFWNCQGGYQGLGENREGCGWFEWAEWDSDGELKGWREKGIKQGHRAVGPEEAVS